MNKKWFEEKLAEFLSDKDDRISPVLNTISDCKITGWEKWLQIEFAHFINNKYQKEEGSLRWSREYKYKSDGAKEIVIPDFAVSFDNDKSLFLVETKISNKTSTIQLEIGKDIEKYKNINSLLWDGNEYEINGIYFIGITTSTNNNSEFEESLSTAKLEISGNVGKTISQYCIYYLNP